MSPSHEADWEISSLEGGTALKTTSRRIGACRSSGRPKTGTTGLSNDKMLFFYFSDIITRLPQVLLRFWSFLHSIISCNSNMNSYILIKCPWHS